jgi:transcriptional regulator with XRE-family HTH domain
MKLERTREWWLAKARREGDAEVGAGVRAFDPQEEERPAMSAEETRIAFGRLVNLMRRQRGLSLEKLAAQAALDVGELVSIEDDLHYTPEPRTVFQLARTFKVSHKALMQLAGLTVAKDSVLHKEAVRFAARSESIEKLTPEESEALESFVAILSEGEDAPKTH